jgi:hypothetical protein
MISRDDLFGDCDDSMVLDRQSLLGDGGPLAREFVASTVKLDWVATSTEPNGDPSVYLKKGTKIQIADPNPSGAAAEPVRVRIPAGTEVYAWTGSTDSGGKGYVSAGPTGEVEDVFATRRTLYPASATAPKVTQKFLANPAVLKALPKLPTEEKSATAGVLVGLAAAAGALALASKKGRRRRRRR